MIRVVLENMGSGIFRINDRLCQKSEYVFELAWPGSDVINISEYHGVLLFGLVHYTEVRLADGTLFTSAQEILDWADTNAFGGGGGGSKGFDTKDDFPIPGAEGILYIDKSDDSMWYWDGTEYVQFTSFHPYPTFADFPDPGNPGYIYLDKATSTTYYWNGAAYVILSAGPGAFIQNQTAVEQPASFRIAGTGEITGGLTVTHGANPFAAYIAKRSGAGDLVALLGALAADGNIVIAGTVLGDRYKGSIGWLSGTDDFVIFGGDQNNYKAQELLRVLRSGALKLFSAAADAPVQNGGLLFRTDLQKFRAALNGVWKNLATEDQIPAPVNAILNQGAVYQSAQFKIEAPGTTAATFRTWAGDGNNPTILVNSYNDMPLLNVRNMGWISMAGTLSVGTADYSTLPLEITGNGGGPRTLRGFGFTWNRSSGLGECNFIWCSAAGGSNPYLSFDFFDGATTSNKAKLYPDGTFAPIGPIYPGQATSDFGVGNGALMFRSDTQKFRAGANGVYKNIAMEDTAFIAGRYIAVDQDHPAATDTRTGISNYSHSIPFRTINAAIAAASSSDVVYVRRSASNYEGDIILDPLSWSGWLVMRIALESGVVINGNVQVTQINNNAFFIWGMGPDRATITGSVAGLNAFIVNYAANLNVVGGFYGAIYSGFVMENCGVTYPSANNPFPSGTFRDCELDFQAEAVDYGFRGNSIFNNCKVNFAGSVVGYVQGGAGDLQFENCRVKIAGAVCRADDHSGGTFRVLMRNSRISFGPFLINNGNTDQTKVIIHSCQLISSTPGTAVLFNPSGGVPAYTELIGTVRNCAVGVAATVSANDVQAPSITEF